MGSGTENCTGSKHLTFGPPVLIFPLRYSVPLPDFAHPDSSSEPVSPQSHRRIPLQEVAERDSEAAVVAEIHLNRQLFISALNFRTRLSLSVEGKIKLTDAASQLDFAQSAANELQHHMPNMAA